MRLVVTEFITVNGVIDTPAWTAPFQHDDIEALKHEELFAANAMLLGRVTYEMFAGAWPSITDELGFADRMNSLPKHVVSTTTADPTWNATFVRPASSDALAGQIRRIKSDGTGDLLVGGSATLARFLFANNLVDELRLLTYPVVVGAGQRLFDQGIDTTFTLAETRSFPTGVVLTTYRPA